MEASYPKMLLFNYGFYFVVLWLNFWEFLLVQFSDFMRQMETCMHINAAMFLQIGQSGWWCMAGICSILTDEDVCYVEPLDTGDMAKLYSKQCACKRPGKNMQQ